MKVVTMYLPQFHRVKENDEWWEVGYTEWTAVKRAKKQFDSHNQPRIPLNENYYNLLDHDVMLNQAILMENYGIDVQCFYHYWFKDGRRILEKPAENLLQWTDINMPFCFCWANETWARTWSAVKDKNTWNDNYSEYVKDSGNGILIEQDYGDELDWINHFKYLLPFFCDDRYIKINNKPVFSFYQSDKILCLNEMIKTWDNLAKVNGFDGIYTIGANCGLASKHTLNKILIHEPQNTAALFRHRVDYHPGKLITHNYNEVWEELLRFSDPRDNVIYGGFVGYDDSPRRSSNATVIENQTPEAFKEYFTRLLVKNYNKGNELVFLNAWNEWGEGMYLEPDEDQGYSYLAGVKYAKDHFEANVHSFEKIKEPEDTFQIQALKKQNERYKSYWVILDNWLCLKENGVEFQEFFIKRGIKTIAIYGMGMLGKHFFAEMITSEIKVLYGIDQQGQNISNKLSIYRMEEELPRVDAVVVTVSFGYDEIVEDLKNKGVSQVFMIGEVIERLSLEQEQEDKIR